MTAGPDELFGLAGFARRLRRGETSAREGVEACLARIAAEDGKSQSFVHVAEEAARQSADDIDRRLAAGDDPGPLSGVPVAVKDLFAVEGMPTKAGSRLDVADIVGAEGPFVARLKAAGAIVLGKARTIEFAAGAHNLSHPTPWNPADREIHRTPGGSSSGSAVAVAAGLTPLAVGTDTGGSVRSPAALCGVAGYKSTRGRHPAEGVFPLCPALDSIGLIARDPADLVVARSAIEGALPPDPVENPFSLRLGVPPDWLLARLDVSVAQAFEAALRAFAGAGIQLSQVNWPTREEVRDIDDIFAGLVSADLAQRLGLDRVERQAPELDPVTRDRLAGAAAFGASDYARLATAQRDLERRAAGRLANLDALIQPTVATTACSVAQIDTVAAATDFNARALGLTRLANAYGFAAVSIPMGPPETLPMGLDIAGVGGTDRQILAVATALAAILARRLRPNGAQ